MRSSASRSGLALALLLVTGGCVDRASLYDGGTSGEASVAVDGDAPETRVRADAASPLDGGGVSDSNTDASGGPVGLDGPRRADASSGVDGSASAAAEVREAGGVVDVSVQADVDAGNPQLDAGGPRDDVAAPDVPRPDSAVDLPVPDAVRSDVFADAPAPRDVASPDLPNPCSPNPCAHGSCTASGSGFKCACSAGWGGTTCQTGSCSNMSCPSSTTCRVPVQSAAAVCYPSTCAGASGLCMAENSDGSGDAVIISGRNSTFAELAGSDWRNRARYFGYLDEIHGACVCVFPQTSEGGTPLVISLGQVKTKASGFGQSNSWNNPPTCDCP